MNPCRGQEDQRREWAYRIALMVGSLALVAAALGQGVTTASMDHTQAEKERGTKMHATGTFDVKMTPLPEDGASAAGVTGRMSLEKQFHGDLEGTSRGEMLTAMTAAKGSAGYVAIERVTGTLGGRTGSFVLQHSGTMTRGVPTLLVTVIPDSGMEGLAGLSGAMTIQIVDGKHSYAFDYTLSAER